ncbi:MAG TPA: hypothetical protein VIV58_30530 [Kofleriaceae bacterium]
MNVKSAQRALIDRSDVRSWSPAVVVADPDPEIATNEEWRAIMVQARKDQKFTQAELGGRVGTSQNIISLIENGPPDGVAASRFVMPICRVLKIPPPMHFESEEQKAWSQLGHVLRSKSMKQFKRAMALVESMVEDENDQPTSSRPSNDERARK